jgi:hypothetical protein
MGIIRRRLSRLLLPPGRRTRARLRHIFVVVVVRARSSPASTTSAEEQPERAGGATAGDTCKQHLHTDAERGTSYAGDAGEG